MSYPVVRTLAQSSLIALFSVAVISCGGATGDAKSNADAPQIPGPATSVDGIVTDVSLQLESVALMIGATSGDPTSLEAAEEAEAVADLASSDFGLFATTTTTVFCGPDPATDTGNGSVTAVRTDNDPAGPSTGDSVTITFANCVQFGRTIDGTRSYTINSATGTPGAGLAYSFDATRATNLNTTSSRGARQEISNAQTVINDTGTILTITHDGNATGTFTPVAGTAETRNRTFTASATRDRATNSYTRSFNSSSQDAARGNRSAETITPLSGTIGSPPSAGVIKLTAQDLVANVTRTTTITALPNGTARVETDQNGDGVADLTVEVPWNGIIGIGLRGATGFHTPGIASTSRFGSGIRDGIRRGR